jgi:formylglycine-generating enzyme required for sulfatase activity
MKNIPAGTFSMGCTTGDNLCDARETPVHNVTLSAFQVGETEVTQAQWQVVMGSNPSYFPSCAQCPVEQVSWYDALVFCNRLSESQGLKPCYYSDAGFTQVYGKNGSAWSLPNSGVLYRNPAAKGYRLPTEAEWEYAARGGNNSFVYSGSNTAGNVAWYGNPGSTQSARQKSANSYGLYDMSGNVFEWCEDDWHNDYNGAPSTGSAWIESPRANTRIIRGGSFINPAENCRVSYRGGNIPSFRHYSMGFRIVIVP